MLPTRRSTHRALAGLALVALAGLTGCADVSSSPESTANLTQAPATAAPADPGVTASGHHGSEALGLYAVQTGPLGVIATDGVGHVLYRSDSDSATPPTSACTDACADTWLPLLLPEGTEPELLGVDADRVGTIPRADGGQQITLGGWPLYRRADDDGLLQSTGAHGADGVWFAVTPRGEKAELPS